MTEFREILLVALVISLIGTFCGTSGSKKTCSLVFAAAGILFLLSFAPFLT